MLTVLGLAAASLSVTVLWPQVRLSCGQGRTQGLSPVAAWLAVALNVDWLVFAVLAGNPVQALTHVVVGAGNTAVLVALLLTQPRWRTARALRTTASGAAALVLLAAGAVAAVLAGADATVTASALGTAAGLVGVAAVAVQPLRLLLDRAPDLTGVSAARWRLAAASSLAWAVHGLATGEPLVALFSGVDVLGALATCALLQARRPARGLLCAPALVNA